MLKACIIKQAPHSTSKNNPSSPQQNGELFSVQDDETLFQIKPLPQATLFSQLNKLFRLNLPSERDLSVWQTLCKKSVSGSISLTDTEGKISLGNLKQLAIEVVSTSLNIENPEPTKEDYLLQLIAMVEDLQVFNQTLWLKESLNLLNQYHQGGLHGHYFLPEASSENLKTLLEHEGYRTDCFDWGVETEQAVLMCLGLTHCYPWTQILDQIPTNEESQNINYLLRLKRIQQFIKKHTPNTLPDISQPFVGPEKIQTFCKQTENWLNNEFAQMARALGMSRPLKKLVLVEGATEELLLPIIAKIIGLEFNVKAIGVKGVGGKNQMVEIFAEYTEKLNIPVVVLLDKDAENLLDELNHYRRPQDKILILETGEIEDYYSPELIVKTIQRFYTQDEPELENYIQTDKRFVSQLQEIWQQYGLGRFNKVQFAQELAQVMAEEQIVGSPLRKLIENIVE